MRSAPAQPFVTYYDEATGERTELSVKSLANWVAKTHFLLIDELVLDPGPAAYVALPAHWLSIAPILACFTAGLCFTESPADAEVAFVTAETAASAAGVPDVFVLGSGITAAVGLGDAVPDGTSDYIGAVRPQPDKWPVVQLQAGASDAAFSGRTRGELDSLAVQRAADIGLGAGGRLLCTCSWNGPGDWVDSLLAPLAVGGSVVFVHNAADEAVLARRAEQERTTARCP